MVVILIACILFIITLKNLLPEERDNILIENGVKHGKMVTTANKD
jgi:hypothetical protein